MEQQLIQVLEQTQSSQEEPRKQAEQHLQDLYYNPDYPLTLCSIASHTSVPSPLRQAALLALKTFVLAGWSPGLDEFKGQILVTDENKERIRAATLDLATSDNAERKIQSAASYVVSKIASADFPQDWSGLLPTLLHIIPTSSGSRLHGALKVLADLVEDGFNETQFFQVAQELVSTVHGTAQNTQIEPALRALAVSIFKGCFDTLEMVIEDHKSAVKRFAEQTVDVWMSLFQDVMSASLPGKDGREELYNGMVALKVQVVKVLMKVRIMFPSILAPRSKALFSTTWEQLSTLQQVYQSTYIDDDQEGRLEDADGLPYTLDFLILEDLDFLQACLRAPPVAKELDQQLNSNNQQTNWVTDLVRLATLYAQITNEEENIWEFDVNVFLSEETSVTANYTPRTACGDLVVKLGEKHAQPTLEALLSLLQSFRSSSSSPKAQEAALYLLNQLLIEWSDDEDNDRHALTRPALLEQAQHAMQSEHIFLRARGFVVASTLVKTAEDSIQSQAAPLLEATLRMVTEDKSEIVQASCIRALQNYLSALPKTMIRPLQNPIITAIAQWYSTKNTSELSECDDLVITVLETLRDAILLDTTVCVTGEALGLLFSIATAAVVNFQVTALVTEVFEEICESIQEMGKDQYDQLCEKVAPSLVSALEVSSVADENPLANLAAELLCSLSSHTSTTFPPSFIPTLLPKLIPHLLHSTDSELLKSATATLRSIVEHDSRTLFNTTDATTSKSGLETVLIVIDRLLGPEVEDNAAAEVGGLAGSVVEAAGHEQLGPYLVPLLQAVALRLARATQAQLIQSLVLVFARLAIHNPSEIVDFLASLEIPTSSLPADATSANGLSVLLPKWLDASGTFVGYAAIRTNVTALATLYTLHDQRIASISCKGDLIPNPATAGRIVTRSRAKQMPDHYTTISADVKIIKVLIEELSPPADASAPHTGAAGTRDASDDEDEVDGDGSARSSVNGDEWEDDDTFLDLGLGATKAELMGWANEDGKAFGRQGQRSDDETQMFLGEWFRKMAMEDGGRERFVEILGGMTERERERLVVLG